MKLTKEQAEEVFDLILTHGLHHREADDSYRRDFVMLFTVSLPMAYVYRDINSRPVDIYSDSGLTEPSIGVFPRYTPNAEEKSAFDQLNKILERFLENI